jgi:hypothetical protein
MHLFGLLLSILAFASLLKLSLGQDVSIQTSFIFTNSQCNSEQEKTIRQALSDALILANAALDDSGELLSDSGGNHKYINFDTEAAIEYWGPPSENLGYRQSVVDTFIKATQARRGWGWSDWWNSRYIRMHCDDVDDECEGDVAVAYYKNATANYMYPGIVWCPAWFKYLRDHAGLVWDIEHDLTGQKRPNARNMRSRGASALHELLHVRDSNAEICQGGCKCFYLLLSEDFTWCVLSLTEHASAGTTTKPSATAPKNSPRTNPDSPNCLQPATYKTPQTQTTTTSTSPSRASCRRNSAYTLPTRVSGYPPKQKLRTDSSKTENPARRPVNSSRWSSTTRSCRNQVLRLLRRSSTRWTDIHGGTGLKQTF